MEIILKRVRLAFPAIFSPKAVGDGGEAKYSAVFIIDPDSENVSVIKSAIQKAAAEKWGAKAAGVLTKLTQDGRSAYHTAPKTNSAGEVYAGFEGKHWLSASNKARPLVVDRNPKVQLSEEDGRPYAGCYVNAKVRVWAQDNQYGKRINASLLVVQFAADGEPFAGSSPSIEGLEDLGDIADELKDLL